MYRKLLCLFSLLVVILFSPTLSAQQVNPCGTNEMLELEIEKYPEIIQTRNNFDKKLKNYLSKRRKSKNTQKRIIPVVFHVIHEGGSENISKAQIIDQLRIMNEDFNRLNPDTLNTPAPFASVAANCNIEFRLATLDPSGDCTDGINRVYSSLTNEARNNVKAISYWNSQSYLNVWVVRSILHSSSIGTKTLGYAQFPAGGMMSTDGIVLCYDFVGSIGAASGQVGRTAIHEIGHWLGLRHIWGDSECGSDAIYDTPVHKEANFGVCSFPYFQTKPNGDPFCADADTVNGEMFMNYMDYSNDNCMNMFSEGQKAAMDFVLDGDSASVYGWREYLWSDENLIATGTNDGAVIGNCTPKIAFTARPVGSFGPKTLICEGENVHFVDFSFNYIGQISREWTFHGGIPSNSTDSTPTITYNTSGVYDVTLKITTSNGDISQTKSKYIVVDPSNAPSSSNFYSFGFEDVNDFNDNWIIQNVGIDANNQWSFDAITTPAWELSSDVSFEGNNSIRMEVFESSDLGEDALITPPLDLSGINNVQIKFRHAGAGVSANTLNALNVWWTMCGTGYWYLLNPSSQDYSISPERTASSGLYTSSFHPTEDDWVEDSLIANTNISKNNLRLKFEYISKGSSNNFFLDNIRIGEQGSLNMNNYDENSLNSRLLIFPNPTNRKSTIAIENFSNMNVELRLHNILGAKLMCLFEGNVISNYQIIDVDFSNLNNGIYFISIYADGKPITTQKIFINK